MLALLPPDAYALKLAAIELAQAAENLDLLAVMHLARQLGPRRLLRSTSKLGEKHPAPDDDHR